MTAVDSMALGCQCYKEVSSSNTHLTSQARIKTPHRSIHSKMPGRAQQGWSSLDYTVFQNNRQQACTMYTRIQNIHKPIKLKKKKKTRRKTIAA